ncbi:T-lymphocyte surface antigen Ly-9-like isoform X2 [Ursus americanus]|uniref:T-lymphocyte surface antigen Ly-9-like isoform X2 n=1 Tax=Ursus americanus TaxID=9643 RepID=UPI001E67D983|nr:T-lymphocyte surface antigen Ly-9-like isoform X2 [Ursus americanus]
MAGPRQHPDDWAPQPFSNKPQKTQPRIFSSFLWTCLLLLTGPGAFGKDSTPTVVPGILGGSVTFPLNISVDTEFEHVAWNGPQGALALATAERKIFVTAKSYQDRLTISLNSYSLSLSNLTLEDAGSYKAQINWKTSKFTTDKEFTLHVYAPGASRGESMGEIVVGILGESVTLPLTLSASHSGENVVWMFNTSIISKEQKEAATADPFIKFKDPNKNLSRDYSLIIAQLKMENAGHYYAYVCSKASRVISTKLVTLLVYGRLKKPKITWHPGLAEDGICRFSLTCSVEDSGHNVTYRWTPLPKGTVESQGGPHLNVSWTSGENHPNFTCIASNPVSNSSQHFLSGNICPGPERNTELYTVLLVTVFIPCIAVFIWCIWKRKRLCSVPASSSSHADMPTDAPGCQKLDTFPKTAKQQHRPTSNSTSDSSETTEKDQERTDIPKAGRYQENDLLSQEGTGSDSASEGQAEYELITPESMVAASADHTVYTQVFFNLQGKTPVPEQKESSATIYSRLQTPQKVVLPPQQNDPESPDIPTYENFT